MAQFVPPVDLSTVAHNSEADLARAMLDGLSNSYVVMHSLPWLYPARDSVSAPVREGEADFLVMHREHGVLIIEAKGGEITLKNRVWQRRLSEGWVEIKDPVKQARRSLYALLGRVQAVCGKEIAARTGFSTAIAFPHCIYRDTPPPDLPVESIISIEDLDDIETALLRAFRAGGSERTSLTAQEFEGVRRALAPEFQVYEPLRVSVDSTASLLTRLTRQQLQVLKGSDKNDRAIIEGVAGSGKTLLAVQRAKSFAERHDSVLLTCYNAELAKWLMEELGSDLVDNGGRITVQHFHSLAADLCRRASIDFKVPANDQATWWDEIAPDLMVQAALELYTDGPAFGAIVVDEAQDFSPGWWDALAYLTNLNEEAPIWAFLDKAQSLRREPCEPPIANAFRFALDVNCRNTRRIVASANAATSNESEPFDLAPLGRPLRIVTASSPTQVGGLVQQEVRSLLRDHYLSPRQIVLIGPTSRAKGSLAGCSKVVDVPLVESAAIWREGNGILCTTARKFKGLEADVVILYDFAGLGALFTASDLYVAMTRARSHLVVIARDRSGKPILDSALAAALATGESP